MLPLVGSLPTWVTLTVAGLAMGMMIFIMASGLTLVFGLMDVLNFGHGAFVAVGAFAATLVLLPMRGWLEVDSLPVNLGVLALAIMVAMVVTALLGWAFERLHHPAGLRPAPQADPDHDGRHDRGRAADQRRSGAPGRSPLPLPAALRGAHPAGRRGHRKVPPGGGGGRAGGVRRDVPDPEPHEDRPARSAPASRTARWSRRLATASGACSCSCSRPARAWPAWAA